LQFLSFISDFRETAMRLVIFSLFISSFAFAQTFQGTLRGRVLDPNGASTTAAAITLTDEGTSVGRRTVTNDLGEYRFSSVTPSTYTVSVESPGFKHLEQHSITIATQAVVILDLTLQLGQVTEQVNVTSDAPLLETGDASTGQVVDSQKITDLPILGRNTFFTAKLAQSVVFVGNPKFARMQDQNGNSQVSIAGGPVRTNNYMVDGISIADSTNRAVIVPSPEAVQELKLQVSTYDAEVGRTGGGTFNTLLRSGTNDLHGSAVGHIRQTDWLANNFFANRAGQPIADQPFRDWAFSLGGSVRIPKLYDGRNKTFFFITTEAYRQQDGSTTVLSVPTALERAGNFSQSFAKSGAQQIIYDPLTTASDGTRQQFARNLIPASRLNFVGQSIASYYPAPNTATTYYGAPNYTYTGNYPNRGDQSTWKADHEFASWFRASGSYVHQKTFETDAPAQTFPNAASPGQNYCCDRKIDAVQANATLTPNSTTVIAIRWGFNRFYSRSTQASAGFNLASLELPQSLLSATPNPAFPAITMGDVSSYGGGGANQDVYYSRSFNTTTSKFLGKHSVKAGFDFRTLHDAGTPVAGPTSFGFSTVFTQSKPQSTTVGTGSSLASLLLGYPTSGNMTLVTNFDDFIRYYGGFVQDDYRVTPKLTLNFGLRLEHESGIREANNKLIVGFDPTAPSPLQQTISGSQILGQVQYAGVNGNPTETGNALSVRAAPRFGFAYSPNSATVVRGGYGIFWVPIFFNFQNAIGYSQTTSIVTSTNGNFTPAASLSNPYPNGLLQPSGNSLGGLSGIGQGITVFSPSTNSSGYVQQYSLEVQRQAPAGFVVTVGGLSSHSLHLLESGQNINQLNPAYLSLGSALTQSVANPLYNNGGVGTVGTPTVSRAQLLLPFPQYISAALANSNTAVTRYYSFYFRAERRFSKGLSTLASYTRSRSVDNVVGLNLGGASQITSPIGPQNAYNLNGEWSLSTQDAPNRFSTAITYELPFGKGKPFLNSSRPLAWVAGGWSVNGFGVIQSGYPLSVTQPNNNSVIGASYQRPNATGISPEISGATTDRINGWLNPAAFFQAPQFTFGNVSRFLNVRGPGLFNWDLSVFKTFSIKERIRAQFRAEALNATNTAYFGPPNTTLTNTQFGLITSQINNPRLIQLGTRITF
jgi:trimeric autotransporter adhesin